MKFWKGLGVVAALCIFGVGVLALVSGGGKEAEEHAELPERPAKQFNF